MGDFTINGAHNLVMETTTSLPDQPNRLKLKESLILLITSAYGLFTFQELFIDPFHIWLSDYPMLQNATLYGAAEQAVIELQIVLQQGMEYDLQGLGKVVMPSLSFNLCFEPYIENTVFMQKGSRLVTFDIHLTLEYLQSRCRYFPGLEPFVRRIINGQFSLLQSKPQPVSSEMQYLIGAVTHSPFNSGVQNLMLSAQVEQLVSLALYHLTGNHPPLDKLTATDKDCLEAVKKYLTTNLDNELTILQLVRKFGINDHKLKKGFKEQYGWTVHGFTVHERMVKACELLRQTSQPIADIAYFVGYARPGAFSGEFKKEFGMTPKQFRDG